MLPDGCDGGWVVSERVAAALGGSGAGNVARTRDLLLTRQLLYLLSYSSMNCFPLFCLFILVGFPTRIGIGDWVFEILCADALICDVRLFDRNHRTALDISPSLNPSAGEPPFHGISHDAFFPSLALAERIFASRRYRFCGSTARGFPESPHSILYSGTEHGQSPEAWK